MYNAWHIIKSLIVFADKITNGDEPKGLWGKMEEQWVKWPDSNYTGLDRTEQPDEQRTVSALLLSQGTQLCTDNFLIW